MRTVTDTAKKMTALMSKLSLKSFQSPISAVPELVELSEIINEVVAPVRSDPAVRLSINNKAVRPIMAVREQIHQVLLNVVLNAKQAVNQDGAISITLSQLDDYLIVTIDDSGPGIPAGMLKNLFRPAQTSRPGGLGIGLYQCKQIVEAHGGTIQVRSEAGKGTQVRIALPFTDSSPGSVHDLMTGAALS
jgi:signal transduction histidine kinase